MLDNVLHHVVAVLVDNQRRSRGVDFLEHRSASMLLTILQHALYDPTAILVGRQFLNVTSEGVDNELNMFGGYPLESFLNHMVSILILHALENAVLKFPNQLRLLVGQNMFQSLRRLARSAIEDPSGTNLLHYTATVHLAGECYDVTFHLVCQASFL